MKFLDARFNGRHLMPIHVVSYDCFELGARDAVSITFKDMSTGQKFVETIDNPKYEVYVLKKEFWNRARYMDCWEERTNCDRYVISYHNRDRELARILGCETSEVKFSTVLFGYDISIEHFYWIQFLIEYGNELPKPISSGFLDIESDIIQAAGFASPGEAPTSCVTFIDADAKQVYTLVLGKDNLPILAENNPHYQEYEKIKENFYQQVEYITTHLDEMVAQCHEMFDEVYGADLTYNIMVFDDEIKLHQFLWSIIRKSNIDFLMMWNAPYDVRNLIERPLTLGYMPESVICDDRFKYKATFFEEDDNILVHKRNHRSAISVVPLVVCQMWLYAGIRSTQGKIPSLKLNSIAKKELKDEKFNYEEEGSIKTFMYVNFWKYILYNIKDVLLQLGIHRVTHDINNVYDRCYQNGMLIPEAFVSTTMLTTSMTKYFLENEDIIMGTNANRIMPPFDYRKYISDGTIAADLDELAQELESFDPDDIPMDDDEIADEGEDDF